MDAPRVKAVTVLDDKRLLVTFANDVQKVYDCHPILTHERFQMLQQDAFFKAVAVDPGGYGISWNDEMDLSEYELWTNGIEVEASAAMSRM